MPNPGQFPPLVQLAGLNAIRLFVARAVAARPGFTLTVQNAPAIAQICQRLDGIPLALELASTNGTGPVVIYYWSPRFVVHLR